MLTAGIVLFGAVLAISVMENSSGYLMDEIDLLNEKYAQDAVTVSELDRGGGTKTDPESAFDN